MKPTINSAIAAWERFVRTHGRSMYILCVLASNIAIKLCIFARYRRLFSSILSKEFPFIYFVISTFVVEFFNPMISKRRRSLKNNFDHSIQYLGSIIIIIIMIISKILGSDTHVIKVWGLRAMRELQSAKSTKFKLDFSTIFIAWRLFMVIRYWVRSHRKYQRVKTYLFIIWTSYRQKTQP